MEIACCLRRRESDQFILWAPPRLTAPAAKLSSPSRVGVDGTKTVRVAFALQGTPNFVRALHLIVFTASPANSLGVRLRVISLFLALRVNPIAKRKSEFEANHVASAICVRFASRIFEGLRREGLLIQSLTLIEYLKRLRSAGRK